MVNLIMVKIRVDNSIKAQLPYPLHGILPNKYQISILLKTLMLH
jgi:hypothetical protein